MLQIGDKMENFLSGCDKGGLGGVLWVKAFPDDPLLIPLQGPAGSNFHLRIKERLPL